MSVSAINYLHTPIMSHQENVDLWDRPAMKCEKKRRGAITPTSNAAQHRRKSSHQKHLVTWAESVSVEMELWL